MSRRIACALVVAAICAFVPRCADAGILYYEAFLDGPSEAPPNASPGTGYAFLTINTTAHTMALDVTFSDLIGPTTVAHIHGPTAAAGAGTAGVATEVPTFTGFPVGVTSGTYDHILDLTLAATYNPAFLTAHGGVVAGAEAALLAAIADGKAYLNIHTTAFPGGEIRGFFAPAAAPVPEPATLGMWLFGATGIAIAARRRKRSTMETAA
jgi:hypothetical protein